MLADGRPEHTTESIYACAHDWVSQGHQTLDGLLEYYEDYYEADGKTKPLWVGQEYQLQDIYAWLGRIQPIPD